MFINGFQWLNCLRRYGFVSACGHICSFLVIFSGLSFSVTWAVASGHLPPTTGNTSYQVNLPFSPQIAMKPTSKKRLKMATTKPTLRRFKLKTFSLSFGRRNPNILNSVAFVIGKNNLARKWSKVSQISKGFKAGDKFFSQFIKGQNKSFIGRLQEVNTVINQRISYRSDKANHGRLDYWSSLDETLKRGSGDCEDYAIAKYTILKKLGVPARAMQMIIVRNLRSGRYHAVLGVHYKGKVYYLDSNSSRLLRRSNLGHYMPLISFSGNKSWIHGFKSSNKMAKLKRRQKGPIIPG